MSRRIHWLFITLVLTALCYAGISMLQASSEVTFSFKVNGAKRVKVYGSFNSWSKGFLLKRNGNGKWAQTVELQRGRYEYKYLVDGKWKYDSAMPTIDDGLYSRNNVIIVR